MLCALLLEASRLVTPLHLEPTRPPVASVREIVLRYAGSAGPGPDEARSKEEALVLAKHTVLRLRAGVDFARTATELSQSPTAADGGFAGTFVPGVLASDLDAFVFAAKPGDVSDPFDQPGGIRILQRVEAHAAVLRILVVGDAARRAERAKLVTQRLAAGEDFAVVARELSDDRESAERGGQFAIYERGRGDVLLKRAAFEARLGEVFGPVDVPPIGLNWLKRVPLDAVDAKLAEDEFVRLSAILFQFDTLPGVDPVVAPNEMVARNRAETASKRIAAGEDFAQVARELTDDPGGRERGGDLGWVHRATPGLLDPIRLAFQLPPGGVAQPLRCAAGWVIVKRVR